MSDQEQAHYHKAQINPDIDSISSLNLYEGQRVKHELIYGVVKDRKTGQFHHDYVTFKTLRKTKATPWKPDPKASFTLSEDKTQELSRALEFLQHKRGLLQPAKPQSSETKAGASEHHQLIGLLEQLDQQDRLELVLRLIRDLKASDAKALIALLEQQEQAELEAAERLFLIGNWRKSLREYHRLLKSEASARSLRQFLAGQLWILGAEQAQLLTLSDLWPEAAEVRFELLLLKKSPHQLELIACGALQTDSRLLDFDPEYASWYPCVELSILLGQVQYLLAQLRQQQPEQAIRCRILMGFSQAEPEVLKALKGFNQSLSRIEILSYDQLDTQAIRALSSLQQYDKEHQ